jgi:hypothetical protein
MKLHTLVPACIVLVAPALARADDAADHVAKGTRFYNVQDWANAISEYKQAYTLDPKPDTLWAIAQTQRLSGDCRSAILTYKAYMRTASAAGANAATDFIKKCQADLEAQQRALDAPVTPPPKEPVTTQPVTPPPQPVTPTTPVAMPIQPPPPPPPPAPASWYSDKLGDALAATGVVGLAVGTVFLISGNSKMSDAAHATNSGVYDSDVSSAKTSQTTGVIVLGAGVVLAAAAVWRYTHHTNEPEKTMIGLAPMPGGGVVGVGGTF